MILYGLRAPNLIWNKMIFSLKIDCVKRIANLSKLSLSKFCLCQQETPEPERSSIYRSLVVNTSKEMMCYSDFPMPADYPNYMHNSQLLQYYRLYADHFDLLRYIHFQVILQEFTIFSQVYTTYYVKLKLSILSFFFF